MKYRVAILGNSFHDLCLRLFAIWSLIGLIVTGFNISVLTVEQWPIPSILCHFFSQCLLWGELIFHMLAAIVLLLLYRKWIGWARSLAAMILIGFCGALAEWVGTQIGFPFGDYHYTGNMGPMISGQIPWAIPLAWWSVVGSLHLLIRSLFHSLGPWTTALCAGVCATFFDYLMEPYAWQLKTYWIWHQGSVPLLNYVSWFALASVFSIILNAVGAVQRPSRSHPTWQAGLILASMTALFLLAQAVQ